MRRLSPLACLLTLLCASTALAADTAVFPPEATNLTEGESAVIGTLLAAAYADVSGKEVVPPRRTAPALVASPDLKLAAASLGVGEYIVITAVRMEVKISIQATLYNIHGSPLFSQKMTARTLDDTTEVADRLAMALHRRTDTEYTMNLDNVTRTEGQAPNRTFVEKVIGARTAVVFPVAKGERFEPSVVGQFDMRMEGHSYFIEFGAGLILPGNGSGDSGDGHDGLGGLIGDLGASYYLGSAFVSPYVGAGLSPRILMSGVEGAGLTAWGQVGLMFMRQSSSRFYTELRIGQNLLPMETEWYERYDSEGGWTEREPSTVYPTEFALAVGVGW